MARRAIAGLLALALLTGCTATARSRALPTGGLSEPVADPVYPDYGNPDLDVLRYGLDLTWSPERRELAGTATLTIRIVRPVTDLTLDFLSGYRIEELTVDGAAASPRRRGDDLIVPAPRPAGARIRLVVRYRGVPHAVPAPSQRGDMAEGLGLRAEADGSAWTMQEPYGAFTWYPVSDQPSDEALYDVAVRVPAGWSAVAHGTFLGVVDGAFRWRSTDPVASYLATLAISRYRTITDTGPRGLPLLYWVRSSDGPQEAVLRRSPEMLSWLEERFGPFPFPSAGVVIVDSSSAMETQQMVTLGEGVRGSDPGELAEVLLHEYAHQWFGDAVTPRDWRDLWLNEGFAMYAQALWAISQGRGNTADWLVWARSRDGLSRPVAGPPARYRPDHFGANNVYVGPMLMLYEIHSLIGDSAFFALCRDWVQDHRNQTVDRALFTRFVNAHTGRDLTAVISKWLDSPTTP